MTFGIIASYQSQTTVNYAIELKGCLESSNIELLNSVTQKFENHLTSSYDLNTTTVYMQYLVDVASMNLSKNFFKYLTVEADMTLFRKSEFHQRSWVKTWSFSKDFIIDVPLTTIFIA